MNNKSKLGLLLTSLILGSAAFAETKVEVSGLAPLFSKVMAVVTIGSWAAVLIFGRLLPYYGDGG